MITRTVKVTINGQEVNDPQQRQKVADVLQASAQNIEASVQSGSAKQSVDGGFIRSVINKIITTLSAINPQKRKNSAAAKPVENANTTEQPKENSGKSEQPAETKTTDVAQKASGSEPPLSPEEIRQRWFDNLLSTLKKDLEPDNFAIYSNLIEALRKKPDTNPDMVIGLYNDMFKGKKAITKTIETDPPQYEVEQIDQDVQRVNEQPEQTVNTHVGDMPKGGNEQVGTVEVPVVDMPFIDDTLKTDNNQVTSAILPPAATNDVKNQSAPQPTAQVSEAVEGAKEAPADVVKNETPTNVVEDKTPADVVKNETPADVVKDKTDGVLQSIKEHGSELFEKGKQVITGSEGGQGIVETVKKEGANLINEGREIVDKVNDTAKDSKNVINAVEGASQLLK